jgi:hypothetical protein
LVLHQSYLPFNNCDLFGKPVSESKGALDKLEFTSLCGACVIFSLGPLFLMDEIRDNEAIMILVSVIICGATIITLGILVRGLFLSHYKKVTRLRHCCKRMKRRSSSVLPVSSVAAFRRRRPTIIKPIETGEAGPEFSPATTTTTTTTTTNDEPVGPAQALREAEENSKCKAKEESLAAESKAKENEEKMSAAAAEERASIGLQDFERQPRNAASQVGLGPPPAPAERAEPRKRNGVADQMLEENPDPIHQSLKLNHHPAYQLDPAPMSPQLPLEDGALPSHIDGLPRL